MRAIVIGAEQHVGPCLATALKLRNLELQVIHVKDTENLHTRLLEEEFKEDKKLVILMDSEPIEIKRKPYLEEPLIFTKLPEIGYCDYRKDSHKHSYKFHK